MAHSKLVRIGASPALLLLTLSHAVIAVAADGPTDEERSTPAHVEKGDAKIAASSESASSPAPPVEPSADGPRSESKSEASSAAGKGAGKAAASGTIGDDANPETAAHQDGKETPPAQTSEQTVLDPREEATQTEQTAEESSSPEAPTARAGFDGENASEEEPETAQATADVGPPARQGFVFVPRLGYAIGGWSSLDSDCEVSGSLTCGDVQGGDHSEASGLSLNIDGLYQLSPMFRLGGSTQWIPSVKGDAGSELRRLGTEFLIQGVAEAVFDLTARVAFTGRVQGGLSVLVPKGFVDSEVAQAELDCDEAIAAGIDCTVESGVFPTPTYGAGFGFLWSAGLSRIRLDAVYQAQTSKLYRQEASSDAGSIDAVVQLHQNRFWLMLGAEL